MTLYDTLGVNPQASKATIKAAYRRLASIHHPDKGGDVARFQEVQRAYEILTDAAKRARYDATGAFDDLPPIDVAARKELIQMVVALVRGDTVPDLRRAMEEVIQSNQYALHGSLSRTKDTIRKCELALKRLRPKGYNFLGEALAHEIEMRRQAIAALEHQQKLIARMSELLASGYSYTGEPENPLTYSTSTSSWWSRA